MTFYVTLCSLCPHARFLQARSQLILIYTVFRVRIRLYYLAVVGHGHEKMTKLGTEVAVMKKLCKQKVIGMRMHQFKLSDLNSVHLICDSYFNI